MSGGASSKSRRAAKSVKVWACLTDGELTPYGNGAQWQYPLFIHRRDAIDWRKESYDRADCRIVRVNVTIIGGRK